MNSYFSEAGVFLISFVAGFLILMIMLRFILQWVRADFYNPISQFIVKITTPLLAPFRRFIPGVAGLDMAALVLMLLIKYLELLLTFMISGTAINFLVILILSITGLLKLFIYVFIIAIIVAVVASWIAPGGYNPALNVIEQITRPVMQPIRRFIKPISGLDLSPLVALLLLNLIVMAIPYIERSLLQMSLS